MNKSKTKEELISIYDEVIKDIKNGYYFTIDKRPIYFRSRELKEGSIMYHSLEKIKNLPNYPCTKIYVENKDTLEKAIEMGEKCAVLNMASYRNPGGGVANGSRAQEEELCRRTNLLYSLYSFTTQGKVLFGFMQKVSEYPIPKFGGIYSPVVTIYREPQTYKEMDFPKYCSVISVSGINRPNLDNNGMLYQEDVQILKAKIRAILRIAITHGHSKIVLGALGCGAYRNPPRHVAKLFKEVLEEKEFVHSFEEVCFAILEDKNSIRRDNPEGNLKPFKEILENESPRGNN